MTDSGNRSRTADEAENDVEAARTELVRSIGDLEARLSPNALVEQGLAYFKGDGRRHMDGLARRAEANPLSLLLIGFGLAWFAFGPKGNPRHGSSGRLLPVDFPETYDEDVLGPNASPPAEGPSATGPDAMTALDRPQPGALPQPPTAKPDEPRSRPSGFVEGTQGSGRDAPDR